MSNTCNCFVDRLEEIREKVVNEILPKDANQETLELDWENKVFRLDGKPNKVMLKLDCSYQRTKVNGEQYRNRTKHPISVAMNCCPFCGTKF